MFESECNTLFTLRLCTLGFWLVNSVKGCRFRSVKAVAQERFTFTAVIERVLPACVPSVWQRPVSGRCLHCETLYRSQVLLVKCQIFFSSFRTHLQSNLSTDLFIRVLQVKPMIRLDFTFENYLTFRVSECIFNVSYNPSQYYVVLPLLDFVASNYPIHYCFFPVMSVFCKIWGPGQVFLYI